MQQSQKLILSNGLKYLLIFAAGTAATGSASASEMDRTAVLRAKHATLAEELRHNQFHRPLVLYSREKGNRLEGEAYAVVDYSFDAVNAGLNSADHWCDVLLLHLNTKYCHAESSRSRTTLNVHIGKKSPEELLDAARVKFDYRVASATQQYFDIRLEGKEGPMGTTDYRILLEAVALPNAKTFLHLTYSYAISFSGRLAMQTYLGTVGSSKVGFSEAGTRTDGRPDHIGGMRGLMERNTMRYYLAIDTFLGAASVAPAARLEKRLQDWFTATERYPRQLREISRSQYVEMKRAEHLRQQTNHN